MYTYHVALSCIPLFTQRYRKHLAGLHRPLPPSQPELSKRARGQHLTAGSLRPVGHPFEWLDGGWINGWLVGWMVDGWSVDWLVDVWLDGWVSGWMNG